MNLNNPYNDPQNLGTRWSQRALSSSINDWAREIMVAKAWRNTSAHIKSRGDAAKADKPRKIRK